MEFRDLIMGTHYRSIEERVGGHEDSDNPYVVEKDLEF